MTSRREPTPRSSRTDDGNPFLRGATGIALVALIALGISVIGLLLAVIVSLGY